MLKLSVKQLGFFLATAGASLLLSGAAHADSVSPSQTNENSGSTSITLTGDQPVDTQTTVSTQQSTAPAAGPDQTLPPSDTPATVDPISTQPDQPSAPAQKDDTPTAAPAASGNTAPPPVQTASTSPVTETFFAPVTIIRALVPQVVTTQSGQKVITMPQVQPAAPAGPQVPGAPSGALTSAGLMLGQFTLPLFGGLGHFLQASFTAIPYFATGLLISLGLFISFAFLLRRWGYAISARGSDPRLQSAFEFASPAMSELVPVRTMYPG